MRHPQCPDVNVTLRVNGHDLKEYENKEEPAQPEDVEGCAKIVRYVESVVDANFSVEMSAPAVDELARFDYELAVYLDGKIAEALIYSDRTARKPVRLSVAGSTTYTDGQYRYGKFAFAPLHTSDDSAEASLNHTLANVGEVRAELRWCIKVGQQPTELPENFVSVESHVAEKALKGRAVSTRAILNNHEPCSPPDYASVEYPRGSDPLGIYIFKYRSRQDLQIEGLIPRDIPLLEREPNTLTPAEVQERNRLQEAQLRDAVKIKREKRKRPTTIEDSDDENNAGDQEDGKGKPTVVEERRAGKRARLKHGSSVEVVDLTED